MESCCYLLYSRVLLGSLFVGGERGGVKGFVHALMVEPWLCSEDDLVSFESRKLVRVMYVDHVPLSYPPLPLIVCFVGSE